MSRIFRRVTASILTVVFTLAILLTAGNDTISQEILLSLTLQLILHQYIFPLFPATLSAISR